jgi:hypothetical protein
MVASCVFPVKQAVFVDALIVPRLATALGLRGPMALAPRPADDDIPAIRLESSREIVRALAPRRHRSIHTQVSSTDGDRRGLGYRLLAPFYDVLGVASSVKLDPQGRFWAGIARRWSRARCR